MPRGSPVRPAGPCRPSRSRPMARIIIPHRVPHRLETYRTAALLREWTCRPEIEDAWQGVRTALAEWPASAARWMQSPPPPSPLDRLVSRIIILVEEHSDEYGHARGPVTREALR